jgi:2-dehydropantoate 2-reductase
MKVSVLGAGAIGSMLGGLLARDAPDVEVMLIARGEHGRFLAKHGAIILDTPERRDEVPVATSSDVAAIAGSQFVLVTVKSQDTAAIAAAAASHWGEATIVSIQNGINDDRLSPFVEPRRLVMGMTATNMALVEPGHVSLQLAGATIFGPPIGHKDTSSRGASEAAAALLSRIRQPPLRFLVHPNAVGVRYNKLAINALGYASCLSASNFITEALTNAAWRNAVGLPIVRECRRVFAVAGIALERIPGMPNLPRLERLMRLMNAPLVGRALALGARRLFNRRPIIFSLQQDLQRRKPTEVDYVNGEIVRLARSLGTSAPANDLVVRLVRALEQRGDGTFLAREDVIDQFTQLSPA